MALKAIKKFWPTGFALFKGSQLNDIVTAVNNLNGTGTPGPVTATTITATSLTGTAATLPITGLAAAQGGSVTLKGGASSTPANAGGAVAVQGGTGGLTGAGGAASLVGGQGGATSGIGGVANVTGGAAGAGSNTNGGSVVLTGGAKDGTGVNGVVRAESLLAMQQAAPFAATVSATLTAAQLLGQLITVTQGGGANSAQQVPTGTAIQNALPADFAVGDSFDVTIINLGAAGETATLTVNTDVTIVGNAVVPIAAATVSGSGRFKFRKSADHVFVAYRIA